MTFITLKFVTHCRPIENQRRATIDTLPSRTSCLRQNTLSMMTVLMNRMSVCTCCWPARTWRNFDSDHYVYQVR